MLFSSTIFLFYFLPFVFCINYLLSFSRKLQNIFLFIVSIFFYAWGEPYYVLLLLCSIVFNYILGLLIQRNHERVKRKKFYLMIACLLNTGLLFVFKYLYFTISTMSHLFGFSYSLQPIILPIGISFFYISSTIICDRYLSSTSKGTKKYYICWIVYSILSSAYCWTNCEIYKHCRSN